MNLTMIHWIEMCSFKDLLRAINSNKEYLEFDCSVFNAGSVAHIKCTDRFRQINPNTWNGYDFIIENDSTTKGYIANVLKEKKLPQVKDKYARTKIKKAIKEATL